MEFQNNGVPKQNITSILYLFGPAQTQNPATQKTENPHPNLNLCLFSQWIYKKKVMHPESVR